MNMKFLAVTLAAAFVASNASAANLLSNGSFEAPNLGTGNYTYPGATWANWTYGGSALVNAQGYSAWYGAAAPAGQDGFQFAALQGTSTLSQSFMALTSSALVTWIDAGRPSIYGGCCTGNQSYTVKINGVSVGGGSTVTSQAFSGHTATLGGLIIGNSYTLTFAGLVARDETAFIDNVAVSPIEELAPIPEPASWALMLTGFGLTGLAMRRKRLIGKRAAA